MGRIITWIVGLILLLIIYLFAIRLQVADIESDLKNRADIALTENHIAWANLTMDGRDAILEGLAPDSGSIPLAEKTIMSVWGIRAVECRCQVSPSNETSKTIPQKLHEESNEIVVGNEFAPPIHHPFSETKYILESDPKKNYSIQQCQASIDKLLNKNYIEFTSGSSELSAESISLLNELIKIARNCPNEQIKIAGHTDNIGGTNKNQILSLERAEAVQAIFQKAGILQHQLKSVGYGSSLPLNDNRTKEERKHNRRIAFYFTSP